MFRCLHFIIFFYTLFCTCRGLVRLVSGHLSCLQCYDYSPSTSETGRRGSRSRLSSSGRVCVIPRVSQNFVGLTPHSPDEDFILDLCDGTIHPSGHVGVRPRDPPLRSDVPCSPSLSLFPPPYTHSYVHTTNTPRVHTHTDVCVHTPHQFSDLLMRQRILLVRLC